MRNITLATLFFGLLFSCSNHADIPVWEITKEDGPKSYLIGTIDYMDKSFKNDREITLSAVKSVGRSLEFVDASFKKDKEIVLEAVKQAGDDALEFADKSLRKDKDIIKASKQK